MPEHGSRPRARQNGLLEERVGEELLLYDRDSHTAHCLSPVAACVWRHCDGERDVTGLAELVGASENLVADALHELREKDLLAVEATLVQSAVSGISRREAIGRVARYGAAAGASLIVSATAATPAMASSSEESAIEGTYSEDEGSVKTGTITNPFTMEIEIIKAPLKNGVLNGLIDSDGTCTVGKKLASGKTCTYTQSEPVGSHVLVKIL